MFVFIALFVVVLALGVQGETCPDGGAIYERGISDDGKLAVVNNHNKYRMDIANGRVVGQPRGINLKKMSYDDVLGAKARNVSDTCSMKHKIASDERWSWVGQNIFLEWSSVDSKVQNWTRAIDSWFNEKKSFTYPTTSNGTTGHYTQVVWASSAYIGCDFIYFYDNDKPNNPYCKLYTCNYGPGGNYKDQAPYKNGTSGCEKLC